MHLAEIAEEVLERHDVGESLEPLSEGKEAHNDAEQLPVQDKTR